MSKLEQWAEEYAQDPDYVLEMASLAFGEAIVSRMEALGINRTELAARMGVSKPRVSQILAGDENLTFKTMAALAAALDADLHVSLAARAPAAKRTRVRSELARA
jgi:transcriptional regulator with XRE-family HTH domain